MHGSLNPSLSGWSTRAKWVATIIFIVILVVLIALSYAVIYWLKPPSICPLNDQGVPTCDGWTVFFASVVIGFILILAPFSGAGFFIR